MRKIYNYILSAFFISSLVACDGQDEEIIHMQNQDPVVTVTSISDAVGYVGNEFTIYGTKFWYSARCRSVCRQYKITTHIL